MGITTGWQAKWYSDKHYTEFLQEDIRIRKAIELKCSEAGISSVEIDRGANEVIVAIHTARPGIIIGRGGQRVDELRLSLEKIIRKRVRLNIEEIRDPEVDAHLVAMNIARQIERQVSYRRAMKQAVSRTMQAGAKGIKIACSGRLGGAEIARKQTVREGRVPLHTLRADIDYGFTEAHTPLGRIGIKAWIYKGDILPQPKEGEVAPPAHIVEEVSSNATTKASEISQSS
jgi:small subunit ribosomal protein S3